mgnify:CR=1 FL=1
MNVERDARSTDNGDDRRGSRWVLPVAVRSAVLRALERAIVFAMVHGRSPPCATRPMLTCMVRKNVFVSDK